METRRPLHPLLLFSSPWLLLLLLLVVQGVSSLQFTRVDFPDGFMFGAGTAAFQYEGAAAEDGRTPSIWDTYAHSFCANLTCDLLHQGGIREEKQEDVMLMSETGLEAYRFTISWSRLIPSGRGAVNPKGLQFYNSMINELVKADLPQSLQDEYGGWVSPKVVDDFAAYADVCFREFGDRVAHWTTSIEPNVMAQSGYDDGYLPPNRCSYPFGRSNCTLGNSTVEPYLFIHHTLLAHASAVRLYREKYQSQLKILLPLKEILHPLVFGDYPETIKKAAGSRLPLFSNYESELVTNAFDFIGLNHYTSNYVSDNSNAVKAPLQDVTDDISSLFWASRNSTPTREVFLPGTSLDPRGLELALEYLQEKYGNLLFYIQENGSGSNATLDDVGRIDCLTQYIAATLRSIRNGANVKGYCVWSFMDQYEMFGDYKAHFGIVAVDFGSKELTRQPRRSARWYSDFLKNNAVIKVDDDEI
uniref:4-hydroxy-7-methoxy-3-oxo-3,4-dihydro-2H-1,4-benzoxazin-2-yl glucosidebeta-D-glucosidase n=1 Tax=Oryza meridionalis TaxID=40149 RepID=A0A0E0DQK8_9ORYZ